MAASQDLEMNPVFIREGTSVLDLVPGKLGDRWLVSTLACLYLTKGFFYRVVPADQGFETSINSSASSNDAHSFFILSLFRCNGPSTTQRCQPLSSIGGLVACNSIVNYLQLGPLIVSRQYVAITN